ncbi:MAG: phenylalanine--tRNA ligase subunit alpha [Oligoflexia bacterium]|nr:phenylalanine--tRNA ligase subunit alpha [Oligoflexia bacterium]
MEEKLKQLESTFLSKISDVQTEHELGSLRAQFLGKSGSLSEVLKGLKDIDPKLRPVVGSLANQIRDRMESGIKAKQADLESLEIAKKIQEEKIDVSLPGRIRWMGTVHPLVQVQDRIVDIFSRLGFSYIQGPEIETDFCNFEALNIPKNHPSRDMQDTLYIDENRLLRTQTSSMQIRAMLSEPPPVRLVMTGAVFRSEAVDATHSAMFHQLECLCVDENVTMEDLKGTLEFFAREMFGNKTKIRLRGSFFPFTEPSVEVDCTCVFCSGKGCKVCKKSGWIEILGAGMVNPAVFEKVGYPSTVSGFALGIGIERVAMLLHDISDIRLFYENDIRFLRQFL